MVDLMLMALLGFLGSFGHCLGMCGPLTATFALAPGQPMASAQPLRFHVLLNLGRVISYGAIGAAIGLLEFLLFEGGQLAGVGSPLRQGVAIATGLIMIWLGLRQVYPNFLPPLPLPGAKLHHVLSQVMATLSRSVGWATPLLLGLVWGLMPCGFLFAAQVQAAGQTAAAGTWRAGTLTMLAFGLGTLPMMLGVGLLTSWVGRDRSRHLLRLGGGLMIAMGLLLLFRSGEMMSDYTGYGALLLLGLTLVARPISRLWPGLMRYRRSLGVLAWGLALTHGLHHLVHHWNWRLDTVAYLPPQHRLAVALGTTAFALLLPGALTSFDQAQKRLGVHWRRLHLLAVPAIGLAGVHATLIGSHFWGSLQRSPLHHGRVGLLALLILAVLGMRSQRLWRWVGAEAYYRPARRRSKGDST